MNENRQTLLTEARHEGRPGWRYGILGPTEAGKSTLARRIILDWEKDYPFLPVWSNMRMFLKNEEEFHKLETEKPIRYWKDKLGNLRILDPRVKYYKSPSEWAKMRNGLLFCDEISKYINSLPGYTESRILKVLLELAANLSKQDMEFIYTDQPARGFHKRARMNINKFYAPVYENPRDRISYLAYDYLEDYEEKKIEKARGPYEFRASEIWPYFSTKEMIVPKEVIFKPERELEKMVNFFTKKKMPFPGPSIIDALSFYQNSQHLDWSRKQEGAVKYLVKLKYEES